VRRNSAKRLKLADVVMSNNVLKYIKENKRIDSRDLDEYRRLHIKPNVLSKPYASALVELGNTMIIVGIHFDIGAPFSDSPDKGILITEGEVLPTASFDAEAGPPSEEEIEISRVVDRSIRESEMIDLSKLVIKPGEKVLKMFIDFNILNDDGNIIDAAVLGTVAAIMTGIMPDPKYLSEHLDEVSTIELSNVPRISIPYRDIPIATTISIIDNKYVIDPTYHEETVADAIITITHTANNEVCNIQLSYGSLGFQQVFDILDISLIKSKELRKKLIEMIR